MSEPTRMARDRADELLLYLANVIAAENEEAVRAYKERLAAGVQGLRAFEHDGDFVREAREWEPDLHYVARAAVLRLIEDTK